MPAIHHVLSSLTWESMGEKQYCETPTSGTPIELKLAPRNPPPSLYPTKVPPAPCALPPCHSSNVSKSPRPRQMPYYFYHRGVFARRPLVHRLVDLNERNTPNFDFFKYLNWNARNRNVSFSPSTDKMSLRTWSGTRGLHFCMGLKFRNALPLRLRPMPLNIA